MRILLLQDEIYLPSLGGGNKANRLLMEALAREGHAVAAMAPALTGAQIGPTRVSEFQQEMAERHIEVRATDERLFSYSHNGVEVDAMKFPGVAESREHIRRRIEQFQPDWVLVNDDKSRFLLESALSIAADRVVLLLQTIVQLPFGPLCVNVDSRQAQRFTEARAILVISQFLQKYIRQHSGLQSHIARLPVFGDGPFPMLGQFDKGLVTMINPCDLKGVSIFLALAKAFPQVEFGAVPTWGTDEKVLGALRALTNVRIIPPADDINQIFAHTRVLLVPSLWPETFGYVVPEAMLHGIPVLASDVGGLPEAKLGVDYLLPISPAQRSDGRYIFPEQDTGPWFDALRELLSDQRTYDRVSRQSREAAIRHVASVKVSAITGLLESLARPPKPLHSEFAACIARQPYDVVLDELKLTIDKDVFPPDLGRCARNLAKFANQYAPRVALDMGCGSGYLALMMKRHGAEQVWGADIHPPAVDCARKNAAQNPDVGTVTFVQSDLFASVPTSIQFDLIIFNQPFGPGEQQRVCGCGADGGYEITKRFLLEAPAHMSDDAVLIMAFSDREAAKNDPKSVARELGYPVTTLLHAYYNDANNFIYEIRRP